MTLLFFSYGATALAVMAPRRWFLRAGSYVQRFLSCSTDAVDPRCSMRSTVSIQVTPSEWTLACNVVVDAASRARLRADVVA